MRFSARGWVAAAVAVGMAAVPIGGTGAASAPSVYAQLAALNPGTTAAEMRQAAAEDAAAHGGTAATSAAAALREARAQARSAARSSSSGGGGDRPLPEARRGDIFWSDSATDHVGLYADALSIVEAPGRGDTVRVRAIWEVDAPRHTELMMVNTRNDGKSRIKFDVRHRAAEWAKTKVNKKYNSNFAFNKKVNAKKYNCSQLVWAAWKVAAGIDLDNGASLGVYPGDIREDRRTYVYRRSIG